MLGLYVHPLDKSLLLCLMNPKKVWFGLSCSTIPSLFDVFMSPTKV